MSGVVLFIGPTLQESAVRELLPDAVVLGPASCGDVYNACRKHRPSALALVDGYFDHQLSVWHKELLWALSERIRVYGAASMGALRAAELCEFGMLGVGEIFEGLRDGTLEDDDEVAVVHESAARGYRPRSEAMVNIRATLRAMRGANVLVPAEETQLIVAGKALFYPDRTWPRLLAVLSPKSRAKLEDWLSQQSPVDQKRKDALALLERVRRDLQDAPEQAAPRFRFEVTDAWRGLQERLDSESSLGAAPELPKATFRLSQAQGADIASSTEGEEELRVARALDQLREVNPSLFESVWQAALERALSMSIAESQDARPPADEVQAEFDRARRELGLLTPEATDAWLERNQLSLHDFSKLAYGEALARRFAREARRSALREVVALLTLRGELPIVASGRPS